MREKYNYAQILILGGTTEGRIALQVCDEAGKLFYYSTRNNSQQVESAHGVRIFGDLDDKSIITFCIEHKIKLIIDATHPFAINVHKNAGIASKKLNIPIIRFERQYPPRDSSLHWFDNYDAVIKYLSTNKINNLLALTGVNSIFKLKAYWSSNTCYFRIMNCTESLEIVDKNNFPKENILFYENQRNNLKIFKQLSPQAILTKESGISGGFNEKIDDAHSLDIPVLVLRRPPLPYVANAVVEGKYGLRKQIENILPDFFDLKTGYTTGSCATVATKAALTTLLTNEVQHQVSIKIPNNEMITIQVAKTEFHDDGSVSACVIKDAGDDPDVTNGFEIWSKVSLNSQSNEIKFLKGNGVGKVTLPGLGLPIGDPAINTTPRKMIIREVQESIEKLSEDLSLGVEITISVPRGEEIAKRTFNPKLGIVEGISILGTSGIVKPFSSEAFVNSIRREIQVAKALGISCIVFNSGAKSERFLRSRYPHLPIQAFVQYGNFIGESLRIASEEEIDNVVLGIMIGKAVKLAEGLLDTHSKKSVMNKSFITQLAQESKCSEKTIHEINEITLARELWSIIPPENNIFFKKIIQHCSDVCKTVFKRGEINIFLISEEGKILL